MNETTTDSNKKRDREQKQKTSQFKKQCKLYLSSVSARSDKFVYLNLKGYEDCLILTNGDYEMLATHTPVLFSIHLIKPKNTFCEQLCIFLGLDRGTPYLVRASQVMKALKANDLELVRSRADMNGDVSLYVNDFVVEEDVECNVSDDTDDSEFVDTERATTENPFYESEITDELIQQMVPIAFSSAEICATKVTNMFTLEILLNEVRSLDKLNESYFCRDDRPDTEGYYKLDIGVTQKQTYTFSNRYHTKPIPLCEFKNKNGVPLFEHGVYLEMPLLLIDGFDTPSCKEFIKPTKPTDITSTEQSFCLYVWTENARTLKSVSIYEDSLSYIRSIRPYYATVVIVQPHDTGTTAAD